MKGFALFLLCALVAVQARHTGVVRSDSVEAALGENPWVVHLTIAVSTSGLLERAGGVLIGNRWILTAASSVRDARFIWCRYGAVNVISPSLVTENSIVRSHPERNIALIDINRNVETTDNIAPVAIAGADAENSGKFCSFGVDEAGNLDENLKCRNIASSADVSFDVIELGNGLVQDGKLVSIAGGVNELIEISEVIDWLERETGLPLRPEDAAESEEEPSAEDGEDSESDDAEDSGSDDADDSSSDDAEGENLVHFVN